MHYGTIQQTSKFLYIINDSEINAFLASCNISTAPALGVVTIGILKAKASSSTVGSASEKKVKPTL